MTEHIQPPVDAGTICEICTMQDPGILTQPSRRVWIRTPEGLLRQMEASDSRIPENSKPDGSSQKEGLNPGAGPETETDMDQDAGTGSGGERELPEPVAAAEETAETQGVGEHDSQPGSGESGYQTAADGTHPEISPGLTEDPDSSDDPATDTDSKDGEEKTLMLDGLFIAIGQEPETAVAKEMVVTDEKGYILAGEDCKTTASGIFAAGDCRTKAVRQLTTAAADGAVAALMAVEYLG